jgi:hypothetical protein
MLRFELKPSGLADGTVYAVHDLAGRRPGVVGWIQRLPSGWRRYGYQDDAPILRSMDEAVDDLIEHDSLEQDTSDWPLSVVGDDGPRAGQPGS